MEPFSFYSVTEYITKSILPARDDQAVLPTPQEYINGTV